MLCNYTTHTSKISSLGLMMKHEQFILNHSAKHIFSQKCIFFNTVSGIVKPSVTIPEKSQLNGSLSEPAIHPGPMYTKKTFNTQINTNYTQTAHTHIWLLHFCFKNLYQFGPKVWDRSDGPSRPHSTRTSTKHLK